MQKNSKRDRKQKKARIRSMVSAAHVLIAVVAIIECLILISFTTFSWIETASSLIIETGKKDIIDNLSTRIPIANALNFQYKIKTDSPSTSDLADLNEYFSYAGESSTQNLYRFARTSSPDGKSFWFAKRAKATRDGLTYFDGSITGYRAGDIIDSNSSYTHFDFQVTNPLAHKFKFYFQSTDVFDVTNQEGSSLTPEQLLTIKRAMRISFQTGNGTPKIYCPAQAQNVDYTYDAVSGSSATTSITANEIKADQGVSQKLFTIGKGSTANPATQTISVRIWLEEKSAGLSSLTAAQLAGAKITINLILFYANNDSDYLYFDDYTFSSGLGDQKYKDNIGGHLTGDSAFLNTDNNRVFFVYQESSTGTNRHIYPMTLDSGSANTDALSWITCDAQGSAAASVPDTSGSGGQPYITNLITANSNAVKYSYFAYGTCDATPGNNSSFNAKYTWPLNSQKGDSDGELRYSAYGATHTDASTAHGAGGWSYITPLSMVYFRDRATGLTGNAYNDGNNFGYISAAVNAGTDAENTGFRSNVMYVSYDNSKFNVTDHGLNAQAASAVTMFYDTSLDGNNGLFKAWVPTAWLTVGAEDYQHLTFRYGPNGYFDNCCSIAWSATTATLPSNSDMYIYTALGYEEANTLSWLAANNNTRVATGVGCWNAIEQQRVNLSTELIDNSVSSAFIYQIGVNINNEEDTNNDPVIRYYSLIPDENKIDFYAYIPVPGTNAVPASDYASGKIMFRSYTTYLDASTAGTVNGTWYGKVRNNSRTYYPVELDTETDPTSSAPRGYWNISVIVDGTYEHFFWIPEITVNGNTTPGRVLGSFAYNTTGHLEGAVYTDITPNTIDQYRWYVPFDTDTIGEQMPENVYFRWIPYDPDGSATEATPSLSGDETVFKYIHRLSDGIYCVITEPRDATPVDAFTTQ